MTASVEATQAGLRAELRQDLEQLRGELEAVQRRQMHQDGPGLSPDLGRRLQELTASVEATRGLFRVEMQQEVQRIRREIEMELEKEARKWSAHADEVQQVISEMVERLVEIGGRLHGRPAVPRARLQDSGPKPGVTETPCRGPRDWHSVATPPTSCRAEAPEPEPAPRPVPRLPGAGQPGRQPDTPGLGALQARMDTIEAEYITLYRQLQRVERSAFEDRRPRPRSAQPDAVFLDTEAARRPSSWGSPGGEQVPTSLCSSDRSSAAAAPRSERSYRLVGRVGFEAEAADEACQEPVEGAGEPEKAEGSERGAMS
eukprot:CAMPEP_0175468380 /NCGR_PEP_ID=MMETSP0095-20121207/71798_1 /TAXON_ID=311494 /ORGANISM="Alexandrium monilatum, Strain CCMP3105" /LENGTH=314 /DNA_ID=CAMNT_0016769767 /DNA_START=1 /DNA_END=942 /DNA_ORIENTATION=+